MRNLQKTFFPILLSFLVLLTSSINAYASPAFDGVVQLTQPSGETFNAYIKGDDEFNWVVTEDKKIVVVQDENNYWCYGLLKDDVIVSSGVAYQKNYNYEKAITEQNLYTVWNENKNQAALLNTLDLNKPNISEKSLKNKNGNILVLLIEFSDIKIKYSDKNWSDTLFSFNQNSVNKYYSEVSQNTFEFIPAKENYGATNDGVIKVKLNYNHPNTGKKTNSQNAKIVGDALTAANSYINYKQYDKNNNGQIDSDELNIVTIIAGYEQSSAAGIPSVWAHKWSLWGEYIPTLDNVSIPGPYTQQGELHYGDNMATIGVLCHELGHSLGLPDLYDTSGNSRGIGIHSLMASGSWGAGDDRRGGSSPTHFDAWSKSFLGFVEPTTITKSGTYTVNSFETDNPTILKIPTKKKGEYFLVENRSFTGFDKSLQKGGVQSPGIAIWHIDENVVNTNKYSNTVNNNPSHKGVDLEEANEGKLGYSQLDTNDYGEYNHYYYLSNEYSTFGATGSISSKLYSLEESGISIRSNSSPLPTMNVTVNIGNSMEEPNTEIKVTNIQLDINGIKLYENESTKLKTTIFPQNATNKQIKWSSDNPEVAKVDETGIIYSVNPGKANIYVTTVDGLFSDFCQVIVEKTQKENPKISLDLDSLDLKVGQSKQLNALLLHSTDTLVWKSNNTQVALVDKNGKITATGEGKALITVSTSSNNASAQCIVNVINPPSNKKVYNAMNKISVDRNTYIIIEGSEAYAYSRDYLISSQSQGTQGYKDFYKKINGKMNEIYFKLDKDTYINYDKKQLTKDEIGSISKVYYYDAKGNLIEYTSDDEIITEDNNSNENVLDYIPLDKHNFTVISGDTAYTYDRSYLENHRDLKDLVYKDFSDKSKNNMKELYVKRGKNNFKNYNNKTLSKEEISAITHLYYYDDKGILHEYFNKDNKIIKNSLQNEDIIIVDTKGENLLDNISIDRTNLIFIEKNTAYVYNRDNLHSSQQTNGEVYKNFISQAGKKMNELYSKLSSKNYMNYDKVKLSNEELNSITTVYFYDKNGNLKIYQKK